MSPVSLYTRTGLFETDPEKAGYQLGKPVLELDLTACIDLFNLIGPQSFLLFDLLGPSWEWIGDKEKRMFPNFKESVVNS